MHPRWILTIADDLTGALEVGSKFAARGLFTRVTSDCMAAKPGAPIFVIDTETRHLSGSEAAAVVHAISKRMARHDPWLVYKKTDSTLRGNIGTELRALAEIFPDREILYVPAYPAMGRTVRHGQLLVDGVPVHQTTFAADPLNPIRNSDVQASLGHVRAIILDGESDDDILPVARYISESVAPLLIAGPAAIAGALAEVLGWSRERPQSVREIRRCLVINGSMHPASKTQVDFARNEGCFTGGWNLLDYNGQETGLERATRFGERVAQFLRDNPVDAMIVFGGDTAFGIHRALGAPEFTCKGEVLPGVPVSMAGGLYWITKAGGFGRPDLLEELRRRLT